MKKNRTIILALSIVFLISLVFSSAFPVSAAQQDTKHESDNWGAMFDAFFNGAGEATFENGEDATEYVLTTFLSNYLERDFEGILSACKNAGVDEFTAEQVVKPMNSPKSILTLSYTKYSTHLFTKPDAPFAGKTWYVLVTVSGVYTYQESMGTIVSFPKPSSVVVDYSGEGAGFPITTISKTVSTPAVSSSRTYATFQVTTRYSIAFNYDGYNLGTVGTYTDLASFRVNA